MSYKGGSNPGAHGACHYTTQIFYLNTPFQALCARKQPVVSGAVPSIRNEPSSRNEEMQKEGQPPSIVIEKLTKVYTVYRFLTGEI